MSELKKKIILCRVNFLFRTKGCQSNGSDLDHPVPPFSDCQPISRFFFNWVQGRVNGKWAYVDYRGRRVSKAKFEEFITKFYKLQGRDVSSGCPTGKIKHYTA